MKHIHGRKTIGELAELFESGRLDLSPSFRRESAKEEEPRWTVRERRWLIESILRGDDQPWGVDWIYLHRRDDDSVGPSFEVIDGGKRCLETVFSFLFRGPLARKEQGGRPKRSAEWSSWGEVSEESRAALLATSLKTIEIVPVDRAALILWYEILSYQSRVSPVDRRFTKLELDRTHGATFLARRALNILGATPTEEWPSMEARLVGVRPSMPLIANAVRLAQEIGDAGAVVSQLDLERRRVAEEAAARLAGYDSVVTISNSSAVTDTLKLSGIRSAQVVVAGPDDEGHAMVRILRRAGLSARAVLVSDMDGEIGLVGCDAVFTDGSFVNRRGTAALASQLAPRTLLVLAESLKRVDREPPKAWPESDLFEIVRPMANIQVLAAD